MISIPFLLTLYAGFTHAFETDHLLAVSNIVSSRKNYKLSLKDGAFWGFGHTSTIVFIGITTLLLKVNITEKTFHYFEAMVGFMLIMLGTYRLMKMVKGKHSLQHSHYHERINNTNHNHPHVHNESQHNHTHKLAYSVGLVHGLAGSGALILIVMAQSKNTFNGLLYLMLFGLGSVFGMMAAAGIFSLPFSKKIISNKPFQISLVLISAMLCIGYGSWVVYKNIMF